ncbi:hypothetical protein [Nocardia sp. NPDC005978]|uniref:hypothetical protein n=1 Tax=unclassified Nocardia TaxID=2637762 RepID=UPI0033A16672
MSAFGELVQELAQAGRRSGRRLSRVRVDATQRTVLEVQDLLSESRDILFGALRAKTDDLRAKTDDIRIKTEDLASRKKRY